MSLADDLNRALADTRELSDDPLARAYETEFRRAAREISDSFLTITASADWSPPTVEQVTQWSISMARIRGAQRRLMGAIGSRLSDVPGVDFNLTQPVVQRLLNQLAVRAEGSIRDGVRTATAHAIARGWAEGRSVPQTAKLIQSAVGGVAGWKATALARTDLIGLSNGAGQSAVTKLNDAHEKNGQPKPIGSKSWLNAGDGRVRETHQDAEGQTVPIDQPYRVGGYSLSYPGDPFGPTEEVMNCRCTEIFNEPAETPRPEAPPEAPVGEAETRSPMSSAFAVKDVTGYIGQVTHVREAIRIFDEVLPRGMSSKGKTMVREQKMQDAFPGERWSVPVDVEDIVNTEGGVTHGQYRYVGGTPAKIAIHQTTPHPRTTTLHELGHWLDHQELSDEIGYASRAKATPEMKDFHRAVRRSEAWKQLSSIPNSRTIDVGSGEARRMIVVGPETREKMKKFVTNYLQNDQEVFARAFTQWAVKKSLDPRALRELEEQIVKDRNPDSGFYATWTQWTDEDFAPIFEAMEKLLRSRGLLDDVDARDLTAAFRVFLHTVDPRLLARIERREVRDRRVPVEARLPHDPDDEFLVGHTGFAEFLRGDHAGSVPPDGPHWSPFQGPAPRWWPEFAASFRPPAALPSRETPEED